jgi:chromosome segregation ATPase
VLYFNGHALIKFAELLRSYRIAHTRAISIEPFEKMLKENTPLVSILDPEAFVEYLNQLTMRGDMVMDELKRVTADRDDFKRKLRDTEKAVATREDLTVQRTSGARSSIDDNSNTKISSLDSGAETTTFNPSSAVRSPVASVLGIFSPRQKSVPSESNESLFSYDEEIHQLQAEMKAKNIEIGELKQNVKTLHDNLSIAQATKETLTRTLRSLELQLSEAKDPDKEATWKAETLETQQELQLKSRALKDLEVTLADQEKLKDEISSKNKALRDAEALKNQFSTQVEEFQALRKVDEAKIKDLELHLESLGWTESTGGKKFLESIPGTENLPGSQSTPVKTTAQPVTSTTSKKKNKKKKKAANMVKDVISMKPDETEGSNAPLPIATVSEDLVVELSKLKEEVVSRDRRIESLESKRKAEEDLKEEVENMRENLLSIGQEYVESKDIIKGLRIEKKVLEDKLIVLQGELEAHQSQSQTAGRIGVELEKMTAECEDLKIKIAPLQSDLGAAQQLATSRFRDLTELRDILQKMQPEIKSLRAENSILKSAKEELTARTTDLRKLEGREKDLKVDLASFKKQVADKEAEMKTLNEKIVQEVNSRLKAEDQYRIAGRDLRRTEAEKIELSAAGEKAAREFSKIQDEAVKLRGKVQELNAKVVTLSTDNKSLRDEIELRNSQYINAQSLVGAMRDQSAEMATQLKEAKEQASSLEEELSEVQRLLSERTREGETMRKLLQDVDNRADTKVREMRERMEAAIEDRERAEEEASINGRRRAREIEDLKNKIRDIERDLNRSNDVREELERSQKEWRWRKEELEKVSERATREASEIHNAMEELRGALDESEKQAREAEKQKADLRRLLDDANQKYEKLQKLFKAKQQRFDELTSSVSSRSSMERDSSLAKSSSGTFSSMTDYVYLKTVLLQFLEQKDKKLQTQLVPVLGKLLNFDKYVYSRKFCVQIYLQIGFTDVRFL